MNQTHCCARWPGRAITLVVLFALLAGVIPVAAEVAPQPPAAGQQAPAQSRAAGRLIFLPLTARDVRTEPPPPPVVNADLFLRPVPLEQVQRASALSVEFRFTNQDQIVAPSTQFSLFYPSRLLIFTDTALADGDGRVSFDDEQVTVRVVNVAPGETRRGRINFFVRGNAREGDLIGLFATFPCPAGTCRSNFAEVQVVRNESEGGVSGGLFNLTVSPDQGPPGTAHTFTGNFYAPGEEVVTWLNTTSGTESLPITTTADGEGRIRIVFGSGALAPGYYSLVAHGRQSSVEGVGAFIVSGTRSNLASGLGLSGGLDLAVAGAAAAPLVAPAAAPAQSFGAGGLAGVVRNAAGAGVAGVTLAVLDADGRIVATATSRADGGYFVPTGLASGQYRVRAQPSLNSDPALRLAAATTVGPVTVSAPEMTRDVDVSLPAAGGFAGTVQAAGPLAGVRVVAFDSAGEAAAAALTDASGAYTLAHLPAGSYSLVFDPRSAPGGGSYGVTRLSDRTVTIGQISTGVDVTLSAAARSGTISGRVTDAVTGLGIPDVIVVFDDADSDGFGVAHTEADGRYASGPLDPGNYTVQFLTLTSERATTARYLSEYYPGRAVYGLAERVPVAAGAAVSGINASLRLGASISGTVSGDGAGALQGVFVVAYDASDPARPARATAVTDAAGRYTLRGLPAGQYTVEFITAVSRNSASRQFQRALYDPNGNAPPNPTPVQVRAGEGRAGIDITLGRGAQVGGRVTDAVTGAGVAGVYAVLIDQFTGQPVSVGLTDADGNFLTSGVNRGVYRLKFTTVFALDPTARTYVDAWWNESGGTPNPDEAASFVVVDVNVPGLDVRLQQGGTISGRVTAADTGAGLAGVYAVARANGVAVATASTDGAGRYTLAGLPVGSYTVEFVTLTAPLLRVRTYAGTSIPTVAVSAGADTPEVNAVLSAP